MSGETREKAGGADRARARRDGDLADALRNAEPEKVAAAARGPVPKRPPRSLIESLSDKAWVLILLLVPIAVVLGVVQGAGAAFLVLIATALITVIALFWSSVRTLLGETPLSGADAYALAAPRAEEEQKQSVLRALKDLEFERSVGKISEQDYAALAAKYRAEAKRLLRVLDDDAKPRRESVEGLVHARLVEAGLESPDTHPSPAAPPESPADAKPRKKKRAKAAEKAPAEPTARTVEIEPIGAGSTDKPRSSVDTTWKSGGTTLKAHASPLYAPPAKRCGECGTKNDGDAVFCKKCGSKAFDGDVPVVTTSEGSDRDATDGARSDAHDDAKGDAHDDAKGDAHDDAETEEAQGDPKVEEAAAHDDGDEEHAEEAQR